MCPFTFCELFISGMKFNNQLKEISLSCAEIKKIHFDDLANLELLCVERYSHSVDEFDRHKYHIVSCHCTSQNIMLLCFVMINDNKHCNIFLRIVGLSLV